MHKSLICITTCNRLEEVKKFSKDYINFCKKNKNFDFLLSVDGSKGINKKIIEFSNKNNIPCLYSRKRGGVGLSKNRVFKTFKNYDYYFFVEDDVELLDDTIFNTHIKLSLKTKIPHFSLHPVERLLDVVNKLKIDDKIIIQAMYGSAQFNFFTRSVLLKVGGWHTIFAKYKRYGHTEHSYRIFRKGLCPTPFNLIENCIKCIKEHKIPPVTKIKDVEVTKKRIVKIEQDLIDKKIKYFPFRSLYDYHLNNYAQTLRKAFKKTVIK
ncbi:glycosyltransferase family 2 protein [Candidatus Woesearchaeota archaeon]|nr:glycosyltransferase family 2 protein [Candidatus Woesearchaeota archaeon]